jgi:uncharacterized protein YegP (UPF0339 family)
MPPRISVRALACPVLLLSIFAQSDVYAQTSTAARFRSGATTSVNSTTGTWTPDSYYAGGTPYSTTKAITNTSDPAVFQYERYGSGFSYAIPLPNGNYTLNLNFSENYFTSAGKRKFNVKAQNSQILTNYDIYADAGGAYKAVTKSFPVTVTNGILSLNFTGVVENAKVSSIQVLSTATQTAASRLVSGKTVAVNSTTGTWDPDNYYAGGTSYSTTKAIANTSDSAIFQSERYGSNFSYDIQVPNGNYTLKLNFSENYFTSAGKRKFNVKAQNSQILTNYDIYADAGGAYKAITKSFPVTVTNGILSLNFMGVVENAKVSSIEVLSSATPAPAPTPNPIQTPTPTPTPTSSTFSSLLTPYPNMPTASSLTAQQILANTSTSGVTLSDAETATRLAVIQMYQKYGIDISLDIGNFASTILLGLEPTSWSSATPQPLSGNFLQPFSVDAPFYHAISSASPKVLLPAGYIKVFQFSTYQEWDGIGIGVAVSSASDPVRKITSSYYGTNTVVYSDNISANAISFLPTNSGGDLHLSFINSTDKTVINNYKTSQSANGVDFNVLYSPGKYPLGTLGDKGGSVAARINDLATLIRPGEATNASAPIPHAIGGAINRPWKARVYPAYAMDAGIDGVNGCTGTGYANTGLVPYGGVIQLDPALVFTPVAGTTNYTVSVGGQKLTVSLPVYRILQAMQTYGYYIEDYGCTDIDVFTNTAASEYTNYGGAYNIQAQLQSVVSKANLYVVPPMVKK